MSFLKISLSQLDIKRGDPSHNLELLENSAKAAAAGGAALVCFPEMATTGFDWKRNRELLEEVDQHEEKLSLIAKENAIAICGSFLERTSSGRPANTLMYFDCHGVLLAKYRKTHLFSLFKEDQHMEPGQEVVVCDIGPCVAGFGICYDLRFPGLFAANTSLGAQVQILAAAFPHPRLEHWRTLIKARAIENQCYFIAVNQVGHEGHGESVGAAHYFGHSMVVDPWGEVLAEAGEAPELLTVEMDLGRVEETRAKLTALKDRRPELY